MFGQYVGLSSSLSMAGGVEAACLGRATLIMLQPMIRGEIGLEVFPRLVQNIVLLPLIPSISVNTCVEYDDMHNIDNLLVTVGLISGVGIYISILCLLVEILNGSSRIIRLNHALIIFYKLNGSNENLTFTCVPYNGVCSRRQKLIIVSFKDTLAVGLVDVV
jgi:hypothetical protein